MYIYKGKTYGKAIQYELSYKSKSSLTMLHRYYMMVNCAVQSLNNK